MKFLRLFGSTSQRDAVLASIDYKILQKTEGVPGVGIRQGTWVDPRYTPFYIDVRGSVTLAATSGLQMSTDGETWTDTTATTLSSGKTYFRVASDKSTPLKPNWTEGDSSDYDIGGNINSLVKVNFENDTTCYSFYDGEEDIGFFKDKSKLKSAGKLILPATTLVNICYFFMFDGCESLTTAPELPATTLANDCYNGMFSGCTSLTTAPALPATTLADSCYHGMFKGCTSLTTAPALPATTLANNCYNGMFQGCRSLTTTPVLPVTTLAEYCYYSMFRDCTSLTTAPVLPATTLSNGCYNAMFSGCTALTTAPELPATTLANDCYNGIFSGCTSLTTAPALPATTLTDTCYGYMFYGCRSLSYIKCLATNMSAMECLLNWTNNVAATGTFVKDPNMSGWTTGNSGIPSGWTVQDAA